MRTKSPFAKYRGIGNRGMGSGRKGVVRWVRELRGLMITPVINSLVAPSFFLARQPRKAFVLL